MVSAPEHQDTLVRQQVYEVTSAVGTPPAIADLALATHLPEAKVRDSLQRLSAGHVLVLQEQSGEILMAAPFSAVPTSFVVHTPRYRTFANCIWDALGIPAMLQETAVIQTACGCCGERLAITVGPDGPEAVDGIIHFAVPAARWWEDIVFT